MRDEIEWVAPTASADSDGDDHLDFGHGRQLPAWMASVLGMGLPRLGWRALAPLALIAALIVGPSVPQHRHTTRSPIETGRTLTCVAIVLDSRTGRPVHRYGTLADLPRVACPIAGEPSD